jgi:7,8-dihydropterin-6-yl-methyl-4-(beta-D-ribofuranosyl)aminobenzene 5'-phosphate synthase
MRLTVLLEDSSDNPMLQPIHGVSFFIELSNGYKILFDTGQRDIFIKNAEKLSLNILSANMCVISHNHYDHAGGLKSLLKAGYSSQIYLHNTFFREKFSVKNKDRVLSTGADGILLQTYKNISFVSESVTEIEKDVFILTNIPFANSFETISNKFLIKKDNNFFQDKFDDELVIAVRTSKGIVVISGCSHRGMINILNFARDYFKSDHIIAFVGGTHLLDASNFRLNKTKDSLSNMNLSTLAACHCTGDKGMSFFSRYFPKSFIRIKTGSVLNF